MRYSLLDFIACPRCGAELTCATAVEVECRMPALGWRPGERVAPGPGVGPPPPSAKRTTPLGQALARLAQPPAPPARNFDVVVDTGVLSCGDCGAWYPIIRCIPELLPDHLRDLGRDHQWLESVAAAFPSDLVAVWKSFQWQRSEQVGANHKLAEIALPGKITDDGFWGPGYVSPFNWGTPDHTWHLIRNFAIAEPLLELARSEVVLDVGCGYAWTTEWFLRSGYEPIGIDICREYMEIGIHRIGTVRPHLLVGDAEKLPIRSGSIHAVLGFEAFHHVPNRATAMREFNRVLLDGRPVVLVEPGSAHEHAQVSIDAMARYGTLEKGMDLKDVVAYAAGSGLGDCRQHFMVRSSAGADPASPAGAAVSLTANEVYTLRKAGKRVVAVAPPLPGVAVRPSPWWRRTIMNSPAGPLLRGFRRWLQL